MSVDVASRVRETVRAIEPTAEIILFGSRARNDFTDDSDWDFLVLVDGPVDAGRTDRIRHALYEIEWDTGQVVSSMVRNKTEWRSPRYRRVPLHAAIEHDGVRLT